MEHDSPQINDSVFCYLESLFLGSFFLQYLRDPQQEKPQMPTVATSAFVLYSWILELPPEKLIV